MAIIPLKQTITIKHATGETDRFNRAEYGSPETLKCRFVEGSKLVRTRSMGMTTSAEAVSSAQITLAGFVPLSMEDEITYTDEGGKSQAYKPLSIDVKRGLNGKALLTIVLV
jgi:hypothetical protein